MVCQTKPIIAQSKGSLHTVLQAADSSDIQQQWFAFWIMRGIATCLSFLKTNNAISYCLDLDMFSPWIHDVAYLLFSNVLHACNYIFLQDLQTPHEICFEYASEHRDYWPLCTTCSHLNVGQTEVKFSVYLVYCCFTAFAQTAFYSCGPKMLKWNNP